MCTAGPARVWGRLIGRRLIGPWAMWPTGHLLCCTSIIAWHAGPSPILPGRRLQVWPEINYYPRHQPISTRIELCSRPTEPAIWHLSRLLLIIPVTEVLSAIVAAGRSKRIWKEIRECVVRVHGREGRAKDCA